MSEKERTTAREYPNDAMTRRVAHALKSGRKMRLDADSWYVDAKTGKLIGPDPAIERPLSKAQVAKAVVRSGRPPSDNPKAHLTLRLDADIVAHFRATGPGWQTRINDTLRKAAKLKLRKTA